MGRKQNGLLFFFCFVSALACLQMSLLRSAAAVKTLGGGRLKQRHLHFSVPRMSEGLKTMGSCASLQRSSGGSLFNLVPGERPRLSEESFCQSVVNSFSSHTRPYATVFAKLE